MTQADIIIIGAGPGGYTTASEAASMGLDVILIERDKLGGTCLNRGCIPTKTLCRAAEVLNLAKSADEFGLGVDIKSIDYARTVARKDEVVSSLRSGVETMLGRTHIVVGNACFKSPHIIDVDGNTYTAPKIIIATGSRPSLLPIPGAEYAVDSDFVLSMTNLPDSMTIIGGGVIGVEIAYILSAFGVNVTILEYCKEILPQFDVEIAKRLRMSMRKKGINIVTSAKVKKIYEDRSVVYEAKGREAEIRNEMVLMAVGRLPVFPDGLDTAGIEFSGKGIKVNVDDMMTNVNGVYAIGDVNGLCMLAHAAESQGRLCLGVKERLGIVPAAVFTSPQCAMVGKTEEECKNANIRYAVGKSTFMANGKAVSMGETDGIVKIIANKDNGNILGCHICGPHASDLIQSVVIAMESGVDNTLSLIQNSIFAHPTLSEAVMTAARSIKLE